MMHLNQPVLGRQAWLRNDVRPEYWRLNLGVKEQGEILAAVERFRHAPLPLLLCHASDFEMPGCRQLMQRVQARLDEGMGLVVLGGLPIQHLSADEAIFAYWILGLLLSRPVATRWDGTILYEVTDSGKKFGYGVRGSATNGELSFHTDNAFGKVVPDYVGLLCLQQAATGGDSRFCSLYSVHNRFLQEAPDLLKRLYSPCIYDRQAEHHPDEPKTLAMPMLAFDGCRLTARLTPNLIRNGYELAKVPIDDALLEALALFERLLSHDEFSMEFRLNSGEIQYVNNHWSAHYRSAFVDAEQKRRLIRLWYRTKGRATYDGN
ncbi:TauD/TfdA family dioxygenase [Burkholderia sp. LMG 21824]|uniref:TauD/TfdA family dioxygenase n=1 Tax=Burkholderia sp. LMG 21824 TaxID=3158172 RepID=UPI003C2B9361